MRMCQVTTIGRPSAAAQSIIELELEGNELYRLAWTVSRFYPDLIE